MSLGVPMVIRCQQTKSARTPLDQNVLDSKLVAHTGGLVVWIVVKFLDVDWDPKA